MIEKSKPYWFTGKGVLDEKLTVDNIADFKDLDTSLYSNGMIILCKENKKKYYYSTSETEDSTTGKWHQVINRRFARIIEVGELYFSHIIIDPSLIFEGTTWVEVDVKGCLLGSNCTEYDTIEIVRDNPEITINKTANMTVTIDGTAITTAQMPIHKHSPSIEESAHTHNTTASCSTNDNHTHNITDYHGYGARLLMAGNNYGCYTDSMTATSRTTSTYGNHTHTLTYNKSNATPTVEVTESSVGSGETHTHTFTLTEPTYDFTVESFKINLVNSMNLHSLYAWRRTS